MRIGILGPLDVAGPLAGARLRALVIALALEPGRTVAVSRLTDAVWADDPPAKASNALQVLVSRLRKAGLPIESHPAGYLLAADRDDVDASRFERLVTVARPADDATKAELLREALGWWRGQALQDVAGEEFFQPYATRLENLRLTAIEDQAEAELRLGRRPSADLTALVADHPLRECLAGVLMQALAAVGRVSEALTVYEKTRQALADELGADPSPELSTLHVSLLRGGERPKTNLRASLTSFVGRDEDVTRVRALLGRHRLITLTGLGGAGKTRLAIEVARTLLDQAPDGVWLVELAPVTDVTQAVTSTVGLRDLVPKGEPADRLAAALNARDTILVLDNCEHVIDAAAALAERLLGDCPKLRILATSREPLNITGEAVWPVEPLSLPSDNADVETVMSSDAVKLLHDRVTAVKPGFSVDSRTLTDVVRICRALDGMPLALELAAVRLRTMTPAQVAARLDDRFKLLTGGSRAALPRHQTLRAMVDWSWELLSVEERAVLRRFSVFSGGATLEAAERVCGADLFAELADKSLLVPGERYRMLETIKAYCAERLAEAGEQAGTAQTHAAYFLDLVDAAAPHLRSAEQLGWLTTLSADHDNINAAIRNSGSDTAVRLVAAAGWYWWLSGHHDEGGELALSVLDSADVTDDEARAATQAVAVLLSVARGIEPGRFVPHLAAAQRFPGRHQSRYPLLRLVEPVYQLTLGSGEVTLIDDDPWVRSMTQLLRASIRLAQGHPHAEAEPDMEAAVAEFHRLGDRWSYAFGLRHLANLVSWRGDIAAAIRYYEQAVLAAEEFKASEDMVLSRTQLAQLRWQLGDEAGYKAAIAQAAADAAESGLPSAIATVEYVAAEVARWSGDLATAEARLAKAVALISHPGVNWGFQAAITGQRGCLHAARGDHEAARADHKHALDMIVGAPNSTLIAHIVVGVADLAMRQGEPEQAALLLAAADAVRGTEMRTHPDIDRVRAAATAALGEQGFAEAAQRGADTKIHELPEIAASTLGVV